MTFIISQISGLTGWIFVPCGFQLGVDHSICIQLGLAGTCWFSCMHFLQLDLFKAWRMGTEMVFPRD